MAALGLGTEIPGGDLGEWCPNFGSLSVVAFHRKLRASVIAHMIENVNELGVLMEPNMTEALNA